MTGAHKASLRSKSLLFLLGYTLALEGSILAFFYYSGMDGIARRSRQEIRAHAALARSAVEKGLTDSLAELDGLRAQLQLYPPPKRPSDASLKLVEQFVLTAPRKYLEIRLSNAATRRTFVVRAVSELGSMYAVTRERAQAEAGDACPAGSAPPCVLATPQGQRAEVVQLVTPLDERGDRTLAADLYLDSLLETAGRLVAPPRVSVLASNRDGLILHAADVRLLRTPLPGSERPGVLSIREPLDQLDVVLTVRKDQNADIAELRGNLVRIALFTGVLTMLAFLGVWALTGRMVASLRHVAEVADSVAAGDLSRRIGIRRNDELGALIDSFNSMTVRLETSYGELSEVNRRLEAKVEELTRTRRRLSEKERLAAVGETLSKISHEIQNKIGGAGVWVQNLERYGVKDENTLLCIGELKAALNSFLDMLVHFKRFYRAPQLALRSMPAAELIEGCLARIAPELDGKHLRVECDAGDAVLQVDPAQMTDAIVNILLNAAQFSPEGGLLRVCTRRAAGGLILSFRDQGPGLAPAAKLFRPFYTTRPAGSGLGLAIARNIIRAHGGRIRAYNYPEGGACFEIMLPVVETP